MAVRKGKATFIFLIIMAYTAWLLLTMISYLPPVPEMVLVFGESSLLYYTGAIYFIGFVAIDRCQGKPEVYKTESVFKPAGRPNQGIYSRYIEFTTNILPAYYSTTSIGVSDNVFLKLRIPLAGICKDCPLSCDSEADIVFFPPCDITKGIRVAHSEEARKSEIKTDEDLPKSKGKASPEAGSA